VRDIVVLDSANSDTDGGATRRRRQSSAPVGEGTSAENRRPTTDQVICEALHLALVATHLRVAWHARAITAERAMQLLDQAFREIRVRNEEEAN
jgi:hypothetical protein